MDFKSMLTQLSQLSEATKETPTGKIHKAEPGGYGRKVDPADDGDDEKNDKKKEPAVKRGRGRPKKGADSETGQVAKYDNAKNLQSFMVGNIPKKGLPGKPGKKHTLKDWVEQIESKYIAEMTTGQQLTIKPMPGAAQLVDPATQKVMATGDAASVKNIQGAVAQGKVQMRGGAEGMAESDTDYSAKKARAGKDIGKPGKQFSKIAASAGNKYGSKAAGERVAGSVLSKLRSKTNESAENLAEGWVIKNGSKYLKGSPWGGGPAISWVPDINKATVFSAKSQIPKSIIMKSHLGGWSIVSNKPAKSSMAEGDIPSDQADFGAGLGAGRSQKAFEGKKDFAAKLQKNVDKSNKGKKETEEKMKSHQKDDKKKVEEASKPDFLDVDKDGNKKETFKKAVKDGKKKKVTESAHKHNAARLLGKHHALAKEGYNCKYEDMEESRCYHEGYKEGLDECYGQMPVQGLVSETDMIPSTVSGMADQAVLGLDEMDMDEGNAFTGALARTPHGGQFSLGGSKFTDRSHYDSKLDELAFESWDNQLNELLNEGMTVSISKGQEGTPDSVSVTAQDAEADQLLNAIKQAGLGLFGGDDTAQEEPDMPSGEITGMSAAGEEEGRDSADIGVVDDNDDMMSLIKKLVGGQHEPEEVGAGSDEGHDHDNAHDQAEDETCDTCGQSECECDSEEESEEDTVDETESYDQEEEEVAEDNPPDSEESETSADENAEAEEDDAVAKSDELNEWANEAGKRGTDEAFEADIAFITKAIAGGLNKEKSTGQTTIPVIPGQNDRMGYSTTNESISDWIKLAGIK